jgi:hypothetical protein
MLDQKEAYFLKGIGFFFLPHACRLRWLLSEAQMHKCTMSEAGGSDKDRNAFRQKFTLSTNSNLRNRHESYKRSKEIIRTLEENRFYAECPCCGSPSY